jgi:plasmid stability protein
MANLTIVVDDRVLQRARIRALQHGTSVNALLREYLTSFAGGEDSAIALAEFHDLADRIGASSTERWSREELYDRPVMRNG